MEAKYTRTRQIIRSVEVDASGKPVEWYDCETVNAAKRKSRELQLAAGGRLGSGVVRVARR